MVRMNGDARGQIAAVRQAIRALDPNVPVDRIGTMADAMSQSVSLSRFRSFLMTAFAATRSCSPRLASMAWSPTPWPSARGRSGCGWRSARRHQAWSRWW